MNYRLKSLYEQMLNAPTSVSRLFPNNLNEAYKKVIVRSNVDFTEDDMILESLLNDEEFIEESCVGKSTDSTKYFPAINDLLNSTTPLPTGSTGQKGDLIPYPGQQISKLTDIIKGTMDGVETSVSVDKLFKSPEIKRSKFPNIGEITEGLLAAAVFARLVKQNNINEADVFAVLAEISNTPNRELTKHVSETHEISDTFVLIIKLNEFPSSYIFGTKEEHNKIKLVMPGILTSIISYANDSTRRYSSHFHANGRPDIVSVEADGISNQKGTKTDVIMRYKNRPSKDASGNPTTKEHILHHFNLSVKSTTTKQLGQVGGGGRKESLETKFNILEEMWNRFGISIQSCRNEFLSSSSGENAYAIAYGTATKQLKRELSNSSIDEEKKFIKSMINAIRHFATLDDPRIKLVQFAHNGYFMLDFKKLDRLLESDHGLILDAKMVEGESKRPVVIIYDRVSDKAFLSIRMKFEPSTGYIRNYIQKESKLISLTKIRGNLY